MIEFFQHLFGLCPDHGSHLNLLDSWWAGGFLFIPAAYSWAKTTARRIFRRNDDAETSNETAADDRP